MGGSDRMFSLEGKAAIVTGASRGLGRSMAVALARAGCDVAGVATRPMDGTEAEVRDLGRRFVTLREDLSTIEPVSRIVGKTAEAFGRVDILVNNAGIIRRADAIDYTEADWDAVVDVNLKTLFFLTQAFARRVFTQGTRGKVINVASLLSFQGGIRVPAYTAAKSGVLGLTRLLANEWASKGINVNAIVPGYMATDNTEALRADSSRSASILERIPAGRWGEASDMDGAVVFLASAASDYVHGAALPVDGGWLAR